jgi:hypothetical protein
MLVAQRNVALGEAEEQVGRIVDQLESIHWQLLGIALTFSDPAADQGLEDLDEADAKAELQRVVECVLADRIGLALQDLRSVLTKTKRNEGMQ